MSSMLENFTATSALEVTRRVFIGGTEGKDFHSTLQALRQTILDDSRHAAARRGISLSGILGSNH